MMNGRMVLHVQHRVYWLLHMQQRGMGHLLHTQQFPAEMIFFRFDSAGMQRAIEYRANR
jgi:hypothetical protein